jgi:hypothetical protein
MSGESGEHTLLVKHLAKFVKQEHGSKGNLALYLDDQ